MPTIVTPSPRRVLFGKGTRLKGRYKYKMATGRRKPSVPRTLNFYKQPYGRTIGYPLAIGVSKRREYQQTRTLDSRTFYTSSISDLPQTTTNAINERQRGIVNCVGFDISYSFQHADLTQPVYFNFAVLSTDINTTPVTSGFFRGNFTDRATDFSVALRGIDFHADKINADDYKILAHDRHILCPARPTTGTLLFNAQEGASYCNKKMWLPFKRQFRFSNSATVPNRPIQDSVHVVYWLDQYGAASLSAPITNLGALELKAIMVFKEPAN